MLKIPKTQSVISSRVIKKDVRLFVSTAAVRRCLYETKISASSPHKVKIIVETTTC